MQGIIEEDDENFGSSWIEAFKTLFKPLTDAEIDDYRNTYVGSELEIEDVKRSYLNGKGCINYIHDHVPFMGIDDEPRIIEIVNKLIKEKQVEEFKIFTEEPKAKRDKRHKKYAREKKLAEKEIEKRKKENVDDDLAKQIMRKNENRESTFNSMMDRLMEKYGGEEDDSIAFSLGKSKGSKKKKSGAAGSSKKETPIKTGRVTKSKK